MVISRTILLFLLFLITSLSFSQIHIKGTVKDERNKPMFAANVYLKSQLHKGITTNLEGQFQLELQHLNDTLIASFIGYETQYVFLNEIEDHYNIKLKPSIATIDEVLILARDPISEQFAVEKLNRLDIYFDPVAQADPLKAIIMLSMSTTIDETSNPSLRGSSPDRSRVILNGVPVYSPVRASNISNQGFFSLFNTEIIDNQYVYASNPPLNYGNSSAGLVEICTNRNLETNYLQLSAGILNSGFLLSQKIKKKTFVQAYGNYQFSDAYINMQKKKLPNIRSFQTKDMGINFHSEINKNISFNSYNYVIKEGYKGVGEAFTYRGDMNSDNKRLFSINNLYFNTEKGVLSLNSGVNTSQKSYAFGNNESDSKEIQTFTSINYKSIQSKKVNFQFGLSHDYQRYNFEDSVAVYYYAVMPDAPNYYSDTIVRNHIIEPYVYGKWNISNKLTLSAGIRSNIPTTKQDYYLSSQLALVYNINIKNSLLLSGGKYQSYTIPNYYAEKFELLYSNQLALDYTYEDNHRMVKAAIYYKEEEGEQTLNEIFKTNKTTTLGVELFYEQNLWTYLNITFANSFIQQQNIINDKKYNGVKDMNYFFKVSLKYSHPKLFTCALSYMGRPGSYYTAITNGTYNPMNSYYEPVFSDELYNQKYDNYNRFDLNINKYVKLKTNTFVLFLSMSNMFNTSNQAIDTYNIDYSIRGYDYYTFRTIYFGAIWQLDFR